MTKQPENYILVKHKMMLFTTPQAVGEGRAGPVPGARVVPLSVWVSPRRIPSAFPTSEEPAPDRPTKTRVP